jgi:D-alanine-D-alanine ligase
MTLPAITILYDAIEDEETDPQADRPVYREVAEVLEQRGYTVSVLGARPDVRQLVAQIENDRSDLIFNLCESLGGVDRHEIEVAALLELLDKPFTGTGSLGLTLAHDKALAKKIFSFHGICYPKFCTIAAGQVEWSDELQFPLFVKPSNTDSSAGIDEHALVANVKELMERISFIHTEIKAPALIEEFIEGRELFVGVLGNDPPEALPIVEWDFSNVEDGPKFATAEAKWDKSSAGYKAPEVFPEDIPKGAYEKIRSTAVEACKALRVRDYGRVDMRLRRNGDDYEMFVIEVNPNAYLEQGSELAMAANKNGLGYPELIERIVGLARKRPS